MSKAGAILITFFPICPTPTTPNVLPLTST